MSDEPHARRQGWLRNGNPPGDFTIATRCGAKTRLGTPCSSPAMPNGRCRMHGGPSTGPRTPEGLRRSQRARLQYGLYSRAFREARREARRRWFEMRNAVRSLGLQKEITMFEGPALRVRRRSSRGPG